MEQLSGVFLKRAIISSAIERTSIRENTSIQALIDRLDMPEPLHDYLCVTLKGEYIPRSQWTRLASSRDVVRVSVIPQGKSIKRILPIVAMIALAVFAPYVAPAMGFATGTLAATAITAGVMFVGVLAINALFPPPEIGQAAIPYNPYTTGAIGGGGSGGGGSFDDAGFMGTTGIRNQTRPHAAVRCIYGTHKVAPDIAAENLILTNGTKQTLYSLFDFGYGNIDLTEIKIGNTPISQYKDVNYRVLKNYKEAALTYYKNDHSTDAYSIEVTHTKIKRVAPSINSNEVTIDFSFDMGLGYYDGESGYFKDATVGNSIRMKNVSTGQIVDLYNARFVRFSDRAYKYDSHTFMVKKRTKQPFIISVSIGLPTAGEWEVEVYRPTRWRINYTQTGRSSYLDKVSMVSIRSTTYQAPLNFKAGHTILEMRLTATDQLNGAIDTLTAIASRKIRQWTGTAWTGELATSNPAWIALDILTGASNPNPLKDSRIDLESFRQWAIFCDRAAPGGGKYYECSANWSSMSTVFDRLKSVMATGRATMSMRQNKYTVIYEQFPTVPVQMFTPRNSWGFNASKVFTKQPHALKIGFIDPGSDWQKVDRIVYNDGFSASNADYFESIDLPLCTRSEQAWRDGRYFIAQGRLRPETFSITADIEHLICERGDLVTVQYDQARAGGIPARIKEINGADITLDDSVVWGSAGSYYLRIRDKAGDQAEHLITAQPGANTVTITLPPGFTGSVGDLCVFGKDNFVIDEFLVKAVMPGQDLTAQLSLVPIARAIEHADQGTIPPYDPPITPGDMFVPECLVVEVRTQLHYDDRHPVADVGVYWEQKGSNILYEIWVDNGNGWALDSRTKADYHIIWDRQSTLADEYPAGQESHIKILPINALGYKPAFDSCPDVSFTAPIDSDPPGRPLFFAGNINSQTMYLTWLPPDAPDIGGYVLKYTPDLVAPDWDHATVETHLIPHDSVGMEINARIGSYLIKTIDTSGNLSTDAALVRTTIPALEGLNVIEHIDEHPLFDGTHNQTAKVGAAIRLATTGAQYFATGTYNVHNLVDIGQIANARISAQVIANGVDLGGGDVDSQAWNVEIQVRTANALVVMADWHPPAYPNNLASVDPLADHSATTWSGWQRLTAGNYTGRHFQFRAVLTTDNVDISPNITALSISVDMEDRIISGHDLHSTIGGGRHLFDPPFINVPAIAITGEYMAQSDYFVLTNITQDGFDLEFFSGGHHSIEARYDFIAKGYGQRLPKILPAIEAGHEDNINLMPGTILRLRKPILLN